MGFELWGGGDLASPSSGQMVGGLASGLRRPTSMHTEEHVYANVPAGKPIGMTIWPTVVTSGCNTPSKRSGIQFPLSAEPRA